MEYPLSQLRKYQALSESCIRDLGRMVRRLEPAKNNTLLLKGNICTDLYLIEKGMLACFDVERPKKYCTWIMTEGDFVTSVKSFNNQVPSTEIIKALTNCLLWALSKQHLDELCEKYLEFLRIRQILTNIYYVRGWDMDSMRQRPPEEFFEYLLKTYPAMMKKASKTTVASLMGISRQSLYDIIDKRPKEGLGASSDAA